MGPAFKVLPLNFYNEKECGDNRGIKLLSHTMMPGMSIVDSVFAMRKLMERCSEVQRQFYAACIAVEMATNSAT